jgi:hypothetical protein
MALSAVLLGLLTPTVAAASHYRLSESGLVTDAEHSALTSAGVNTTKDLLDRAGPATARRELSRATRLTTARLYELAQTCDLLRVSGLGMTMAALLRAGGVPDTATLKQQAPAALAERLKETNSRQKVTEITPDAEQLGNWIGQARQMRQIVQAP